MAEECAKGSREPQVSIQCKRLAELTTDLHSRFQGLEKRLETALTPVPPKPEENNTKESLCPLAETLREIADGLVNHIADVRTLTDRIEI